MAFSQEDQLKYKALYLQTAREYVKSLKDNLAQLSAKTETTQVLDTIHRAAHSLRGQSEMMGYHSMSGVSSIMEKIFQAKKEGKLTLSNEIVQKLTEGTSSLEVCLNEIEKDNKEIDMFQIVESLRTLANIPA